MKITLIQPAMGRREGDFVESWKMEPLSMAVLAGITPTQHELVFYDDRVEEIPYDEPTDLVAISTETYNARRSYQIAAAYRKRGAKIVIGGYHASLMPNETLEHADAIVLGEAEAVWPTLLEDARTGKLQQKYHSEERPSIASLTPDRSIFSGKKYLPLSLVESGRGCKFNCEFCSISAFYKQSYRYRPPKDVVREIEATGKSILFLVDDNVVANFDRAKSLFNEMSGLKVNWLSQGTLNVAKDRELLRSMQKSGCAGLLIGFESLNAENLKAMNKSFNLSMGDYQESIKIIRDHGMKIYATFVFGYDNDTPELFEQTLEFALEQKFFVAAFNHMQPFPGTPLYKRMQAEKRLLYERWWLDPSVHFGSIVFQPKNMFPDELYERLMDIRRKFFSIQNIFKRGMEFNANFSTIASGGIFFMVNALLRKEIGERWGLPLGDQRMPDPM